MEVTCAPTPLAVSDTLGCRTRVGDVEMTKRIAAVTPRAKSGKRDEAERTRGQGETTHEPIGLDLCPHPVSKYTILWAAGTGVGDAREENSRTTSALRGKDEVGEYDAGG